MGGDRKDGVERERERERERETKEEETIKKELEKKLKFLKDCWFLCVFYLGLNSLKMACRQEQLQLSPLFIHLI